MHIEIVTEKPKRKRGETIRPPRLREAMNEVIGLRDDIQLLNSEYGASTVSRSLGISRMALYRYANGRRLPNNPLIYGAIKKWAEELKLSTAAS